MLLQCTVLIFEISVDIKMLMAQVIISFLTWTCLAPTMNMTCTLSPVVLLIISVITRFRITCRQKILKTDYPL